MIAEFIILFLVGTAFVIVGWLIWKKEKITLIHNYHHDKVSEEDKGAYTALTGKGALIIGAGIIVTGLVDLITGTGWGWIVFGISFSAGLALMITAGLRYNRR